MEKIKVAYLPFYTKLYDDENPRQRDPLVDYKNTLVEMIASQGFEVVTPDVELCCVKEDFDNAIAKFKADPDIVAVVTQHTAYSPSGVSYKAVLSLDVPIVVFDTTLDYGILSGARYEDRIFPNHGIHGVMEFCSMLKRNNKPYTICAGHAFHSEVIKEVCGCIRAAYAARVFKNLRIGKAGLSFENMEDFVISDEDYKEKIGVTVEHLNSEIMSRYMPKVTEEEIDAEIKEDSFKYKVVSTNTDAYRKATKVGLALRKWMEDKKLDGVTVNFLHAFAGGLEKMPFPECCKVMERGLGYAGEGDVLTAGLCAAMIRTYPNTTFCEPFCPDWERDLILFSHTGEMNTKLSRFTPVISDLAFPYDESGDTVTMGGAFPAGKAVMMNLVPVDAKNGKFDLILVPLTMTDDGYSTGAYGNAIQGWMDPGMPIKEFLEKYSYAGGTHHSVMVYDVPVKELEVFGKMMGFNTVIVK